MPDKVMERTPEHPKMLTPLIPKMYRMGKKGKTCSIRALYAFNGTHVVGRTLSITQMANVLGPTMVVDQREAPGASRYAMFANTEDRLRGFLLYLSNDEMPPPKLPQPEEWFDRRLIVVTWDDLFYPDGHCVVIWPPRCELPGLWSLRDPWRADGTAVSLRKQQLALLLAGAKFVLYFRDGDTPANLTPSLTKTKRRKRRRG